MLYIEEWESEEEEEEDDDSDGSWIDVHHSDDEVDVKVDIHTYMDILYVCTCQGHSN